MQLFEQALAVLQSGVMILDADYRVHFINQWLNKAFENSQDLQGSLFFESYPELEGRRIHQAVEQALKTGLPSLFISRPQSFPSSSLPWSGRAS